MLRYDCSESIGFWIISTARLYQRAVNEELAPEGITYRQCQTLGYLATEGAMSQSRLAERMMIEPSTLVGVLDRMERDNWITREACPDDRRCKKIHPTEEAKPVWKKIVACVERVRARATEQLSAAELKQLEMLLGKVKLAFTEYETIGETQ